MQSNRNTILTMKKILFFAVTAIFAISCGSTKKVSTTPVQSAPKMTASLEGDQVRQETLKLSGIEMENALSEDGTKMIQRPYKWYAGIGKADNKMVAIELAQREAYATISRIISNMVLDYANRGNVANNGKVQQALTSYWEQVSTSIVKACEPYGDVVVSFRQSTGMYEVTAKVGIRGDKFNQLINSAGSFKPAEHSEDELKDFIEINQSIMEAAKGN